MEQCDQRIESARHDHGSSGAKVGEAGSTPAFSASQSKEQRLDPGHELPHKEEHNKRKGSMSEEMQKYNKAVEKLCTDCAADVGKLMSNCRNSIGNRMAKLADEIEKLEVPNSPESDLAKIQDLVVATLKKGGTRYANIATFGVRVTVSGNKVSVPAAGISGPLAGIV